MMDQIEESGSGYKISLEASESTDLDFPGFRQRTEKILMEVLGGENNFSWFVFQCQIGWQASHENQYSNAQRREKLTAVRKCVQESMNFLIGRDTVCEDLLLEMMECEDFANIHEPLLRNLALLDRELEQRATFQATEGSRRSEGNPGVNSGTVYVAEQLAIAMSKAGNQPSWWIPAARCDDTTSELWQKREVELITCFSSVLFAVLADLGMISPRQAQKFRNLVEEVRTHEADENMLAGEKAKRSFDLSSQQAGLVNVLAKSILKKLHTDNRLPSSRNLE